MKTLLNQPLKLLFPDSTIIRIGIFVDPFNISNFIFDKDLTTDVEIISQN
jgi:hypothetical protein